MLAFKKYTVIFCAILLFISQGCKNRSNHDVVNPTLYQQNDSISNALDFIEVPQEKRETYLTSIQNNGELVSGDILKLANKYFSLGTNKDSKLYTSMLSEKTKEILEDDSKNGILLYNINKIKEGMFANSEDNKYLAITSVVSNDLQNRLRKANFTEMPTHRIIFYYFNRPKYMLMGSSVYLVKESDSYKIVTETMSKDEAAKLTATEKRNETDEYGIISSQETSDEESGSIKYSFDISVDPNITANNTFELLRLSEVSSEQDNNDSSSEVTKKVLIENELFEKYKDKQLRFKYGVEYTKTEFKTSSSTINSTSWVYTINIASHSESTTMQHLGQSVIDVQSNKNGDFIDSDLELLSYITEQSGKKYKNRIVLRKSLNEK